MKHNNAINVKNICLFRYDNFVIFMNSKGRAILDVSKSNAYLKCQIGSNLLKLDGSLPFGNKIESILNGLQTFYHTPPSIFAGVQPDQPASSRSQASTQGEMPTGIGVA